MVMKKNVKKVLGGFCAGIVALAFCLVWTGSAVGAVKVEQKGDYWRIANNDVELLLEEKTGKIAAMKSLNPEIAMPALSGGVTVADAKTKAPLAFTAASGWKREKDGISFRTGDTANTLAMIQRITVLQNSLEWKVGMENKSDVRQQPAVTLGVLFPTPKEWAYWDGQYLHENLLNDFERKDPAFPMACVYAEGWGFSMGLTPLHLLDPVSGVGKESETNKAFHYTAAPSLPGKGKASVTFVVYTFKPDYGFRCALQRYYDLYPEVFSPRPGIDPRLQQAGNCIGGAVGPEVYGRQELVDDAQEVGRRFFCNWAWTFPNSTLCTPVGNYYGHADKWPDWYPPREQQLKQKVEMYARGKDEVAMCHYVWLPGAESELMEKYYPDAIAKDNTGKPVIGFTSKLGGDAGTGHLIVNYSVKQYFIDGKPNKLAEDTMADMKLLIKELKLPGFAFDTCGGVDQAIFADFLYGLTNDQGYRLSVVGNSPGCYYNAFRMDFCLLEHTPHGDEDSYSWPSRYLLGRKPAVFLWSYKICDVVDNLRTMSADEIREAYRGLRDYAILSGLQKGHVPPWATAMGMPKMYRYLPIMQELGHAGWEPALAMKLQPADEELWLSRYGQGARSFLCIGNPTVDNKATTVMIDNPYLGDYRYLFATYEGASINQTIKGKDTIIKTVVPSRVPVILKSWIGIKPQGEVSGSVNVAPGLNASGITADLVCSQSFSTPFVIRVPEDVRIASITLNGARMTPRRPGQTGFNTSRLAEEEWTFTGALKKGTNRLAMSYTSTVFASSEPEISSFPFVRDAKPACVIALGDPANADQQYVAWMIQNYFRFFYQKTENQKVLLPVKPLAEADTGANVVVEIKSGAVAGVRKDGETLRISATTGAQAKELTRKLLRVLDRKYVWIGKFGETYYFEPDYWNKVITEKGLMGTIID